MPTWTTLPLLSRARARAQDRSGREAARAGRRPRLVPSRRRSEPGAGYARARAPPAARGGGCADPGVQPGRGQRAGRGTRRGRPAARDPRGVSPERRPQFQRGLDRSIACERRADVPRATEHGERVRRRNRGGGRRLHGRPPRRATEPSRRDQPGRRCRARAATLRHDPARQTGLFRGAAGARARPRGGGIHRAGRARPRLRPRPSRRGHSHAGVLALAPAAAPAVVNAQALASAGAAAVRASETQYLPTISLGAGYNWSNDGRVTGALRSGWIVAVSTSFPLFNGFVREASVTQAKVAAEVATATSADTKRFVRAESQRLLGSLCVAEQDIALSRESVRLATEELRVIQARYRAGIATILDVLTSQTALVQSDLALVSARFTHQIARASLEALLGRDL